MATELEFRILQVAREEAKNGPGHAVIPYDLEDKVGASSKEISGAVNLLEHRGWIQPAPFENLLGAFQISSNGLEALEEWERNSNRAGISRVRGAILKVLYDAWQERHGHSKVSIDNLVSGLGIDKTVISREVAYLEGKYLIKAIARSLFQITPTGIDYAENPGKFPLPLQTSVNIIHAGRDVVMSSSQVGSGNVMIRRQAGDFEEALRLIEIMREEISKSQLTHEIKGAIDADLESLEAQCKRPEKNRGMLKMLFESLKDAVGLAGNVASLVPYLTKLGKVLGLAQ